METKAAVLALLLIQTCVEGSIDEDIANAAVSDQELAFHHDSHNVLVELDMLFSNAEWRDIQQALSRRPRRKAVRDPRKRWPGGVIPYHFDSSAGFSQIHLSEIKRAMADWQKYTCIRFRPATYNDRNRIIFQNGGGCSSHVGMQGGSQTVTLARGCRKKGIVIHELGHAVGFYHEQSRPDRDQYITILEDNVINKNRFNFNKYNTNIINTYGVPYDYNSIMHYGERAFSKNGRPTIVTRDKRAQKRIGNRTGLSTHDIRLANLMYKCKKTTTSPACRDNSEHCATWARKGYCYSWSRYHRYMRQNCQLSCRFCRSRRG